MAKLGIAPGTTNLVVTVKATLLATGADLTGVLFSDITAYYCIQGSAPIAITLAAGTQGTYVNSGGAGTGGGFIQRSATHMAGQYELSIPNAAIASGKSVAVCLMANGGTSTGMKTIDLEIQMDTSCIVQYPIQKNTAFANFQFPMTVASDHISPYMGAGATVTGKVVLDGVTSTLTNSGAISAVAGVNGVFLINLAAADLNGNSVCLVFSASTCDDTKIFFTTQA